MSNIINDKIHFGLEAVKYKDDVLSWVETMFKKEKKAKDALMKSDVMLVDKSGFLALCNLMLEMSKDMVELEQQLETAKAHAVVWHKYPDEKPIDGRYLFWDSDGNAPHVLPYNDIVVRDNPGVFSTQTHWAYLPAPPKEEEK